MCVGGGNHSPKRMQGVKLDDLYFFSAENA